jgi:hypothetical protein
MSTVTFKQVGTRVNRGGHVESGDASNGADSHLTVDRNRNRRAMTAASKGTGDDAHNSGMPPLTRYNPGRGFRVVSNLHLRSDPHVLLDQSSLGIGCF